MPFDSTAELLFKINANADDAQGNIQRFRSILSKDLSDMGAEAEAWAQKVFGSLTSVQGLLAAGAAALGAAVIAGAAAAKEAADKYAEYVSEIGKASRVTGIGAEDMSKLRLAASLTGTNFDSLTTGLTRFTTTVLKANEGSKQQEQAFQRLGISTKDLAAGEQNMLPLLEKVADRFNGLKNGVEKTAMARELFGRGGAEMIQFLNIGSEGLRKMAQRAEELHLVLTQKDIEAVREFKVMQRDLNLEMEALSVTVGQKTLPVLIMLRAEYAGLVETLIKGQQNFDWTAIALGPLEFFREWMGNTEATYRRAVDMAKSLKAVGDQPGLDPAKQTAKTTQDYYGLSSILETVRARQAAATSEEAKAAQEMQHLSLEMVKAGSEYRKLGAEGKLTSEAAQREAAVLAQLPAALVQLGNKLIEDLNEKHRLAIEQSNEELQQRLEGQQEQTYAHQERALNNELDKLRIQLEKRKLLTADAEDTIALIRAAGLAKIGREQSAAYQQELVELQGHLAQIVTARMTSQERIGFQYETDLQRYSEVELQKKLATAQGLNEQLILIRQFELNRQALLQKYGQDLTVLDNSQGWQGVFGSQFAQLLRHDEEALREWAESADQAFAMVSLRASAMRGLGMQAFQGMAQGMAQNVAQAIIYKKSIGEAMQAAAAATLESIAAESLVQAIYATAIGFMRLAQHDYPAAGSAFTSAALFGSIGVAAAVAGRAIAPSQSGQDATKAGAAGSGGGTGLADAGTGSQAASKPNLHIYISGPVIGPSGVEELCQLINDAVDGRDVRLSATQVKQQTRSVA